LKRDGARVFVDGKLIGYYRDGEKLAESLRELRRVQRFTLTLEFLSINQKLKMPPRGYM